MNEQTKKAFEIAAEIHKQLITLATAIITVTISFAKDLFSGHKENLYLVQWGWTAFLGSVVFGVWAIMALAGSLIQAGKANKEPELLRFNVQFPAILQIICFLLGTFFIIRFGWTWNP